jgi:hypothetical protein
MASVINSARTSTSSVFDLIGSTADAANKLIGSAALAADTLHLKARSLHGSVRTSTIIDMSLSRKREIMNAAREYVDLLEENYRYVTGLDNFNRSEQTETIILEMEAALDLEESKS